VSETEQLLRPIIGIECRTAQEVFDIMCDRFRRASPAPAASRGWEPIETWKPVAFAHWPYLSALVYADGQVMEADWKPNDNPPETGEWWPANTDDEYGSRIYPTHWMPLPDAPVPAKDGEGEG
jgi:hypothetical protein